MTKRTATNRDRVFSELDIEAKLLEFRKKDKGLRDTSFNSIVGWAGNGAIVHYRATKESNATVTPPGILLIGIAALRFPEGTTGTAIDPIAHNAFAEAGCAVWLKRDAASAPAKSPKP